MNEFLEIEKKIKESKEIILTAHVNPDGDAVGSALALYITLKNQYKDKKIEFFLQDEIPYTTKFLKFSKDIKKIGVNEKIKTELLIFLDSATRERTGIICKNIEAKFSINIDHHLSNNSYADLNYVNINASSTSEIIYKFIKEINYPLLLEAAEALYLGLINDTGNFSHSNVSAETMMMATELIKKGVNSNYIVTNFLNSNSYSSLKLMGEALKNFEYVSDKKLTYFFLESKTMKKYNAKKEDTEGIVEKILSFNEAEVSLFLREEENGLIKGSMRSKNDVDVNKLCSVFGGGGHRKASGFTSDKNFGEILKIILANL